MPTFANLVGFIRQPTRRGPGRPQPLERGLGVELLAARGPDDAFGLLDICQR